MKVTPLEIRQKSFEKVFRGYDKDEVDAFLLSLSQQWEKSQDDYKEIKYKLQATEREIEKLREVENTLFKTLKTAEDTGASVIEQANKTAELHLKETQMKVDAMMSESKSKSRALIENAEHKSRQVIEEMEDEVKSLEQTYKTLINYRDNLLADLRGLANDTLEKVERINTNKSRSAIDVYVRKAREVSAESEVYSRPGSFAAEEKAAKEEENINAENEEEPSEVTEEKIDNQRKPEQGGSFFDSIG